MTGSGSFQTASTERTRRKPWDGTPALRSSAPNLLFLLFFFKRHEWTRWQDGHGHIILIFSFFCCLSISNESIHLPRAKGMRGENESHLWCPIVQRWLPWTSPSPAPELPSWCKIPLVSALRQDQHNLYSYVKHCKKTVLVHTMHKEETPMLSNRVTDEYKMS